MIEGFETRFYLFFLRYLKKHSFCSECTHMVNKAYSLLVDDGACPAALESIEDVTECSGGGGDNHCHANNPLPLPPNQVRPLIIYFLSTKPFGWELWKPLVKTEARHGLAQLDNI